MPCFGLLTRSWHRNDKIASLLLSYGADVNQREYDSHTPLQAAIIAEEFRLSYKLVRNGAQVNAPPSRGTRGRTALQAAADVGSVDMVEYLLRRGADVNASAGLDNG